MALSPLFWLFQGIPEILAVTFLAMVLGGKKLEWKIILPIGLILAVAIYLIRLLPIAFGTHFIIFQVILAILLNLRLKIHLSRCLLISLVAGLILAVFETIGMYLLSSITGISFEQASEDLVLKIFFGWPHIILLFLLALVIDRWKRGQQLKRGENHA